MTLSTPGLGLLASCSRHSSGLQLKMSKTLPLTKEFMNDLKSSFPSSERSSPSQNPWYLVATVGLSASNRPEAVAQVFSYAIQDVLGHDERLEISRKIREGLFISGLICGYPKVRL